MSGSGGRARRAPVEVYDRPEFHDRDDAFPWIVTLGGVAVGLVLFLHSTMPALTEQRELRRIESRRVEALRGMHRAATRLRRDREAMPQDPERLIVEFDRRGLTPLQAAVQVGRGDALVGRGDALVGRGDAPSDRGADLGLAGSRGAAPGGREAR